VGRVKNVHQGGKKEVLLLCVKWWETNSGNKIFVTLSSYCMAEENPLDGRAEQQVFYKHLFHFFHPLLQ
jgi:hypothetical protein